MGGVTGLSTPSGEVAVIIVNWNTRDLLARAVASALASADDGVALDVWVVDNASTDGSAAMIRDAFPAALVVANDTNVGFAAANNQALSVSSAPYALLLNSDAELLPGTLATLMADLAAHPECGAVVPRLAYADGSYQPSFAVFPSLAQDALLLLGLGKVFRPGYPGYPQEAARTSRDVDWASGACLLIRRDAWGEGPAFDESFPFYVEETDLCRRLRDRGWTVRFVAEARAIHHVGQSAALRREDQPGLLWRGRLRYYDKHKPAWQGALLRGMIRAGYVARWTAWRALSVVRPEGSWELRAKAARSLLQAL